MPGRDPDDRRGWRCAKSIGTDAWLTRIAPVDLDVDAAEDDGAIVYGWNTRPDAATMTAFAICSKGGDNPLQTYNTTSQTLPSTTGAISSFVNCDGGTAEEPIGGGAGVTSNAYDYLASIRYIANSVGFGLHGNNPGSRTLNGYAICLPLNTRDITVVEKIRSVEPGEIGAKKAFCPRGMRVTGGGGSVGDLFQILLSKPIDGADADKVPDDGWVTRMRNPSTTTAYDMRVQAVCAGRRVV